MGADTGDFDLIPWDAACFELETVSSPQVERVASGVATSNDVPPTRDGLGGCDDLCPHFVSLRTD